MPAEKKSPLEGDSLQYLNELRDMARRGDRVPLLGSALYLLWGGIIAAASVLHLTLVLQGFDLDLIPWIWAVAIGSTLIGTFIAVGRISHDARASADRNLSSGFGWTVGGAASILFFTAAWTMRPDALMLAPAVSGYIFAVVMAFSAVISRLGILRVAALGWLAFASLYLVLPDSIGQIGAIGIAAILLLIVPGILLRRIERNAVA